MSLTRRHGPVCFSSLQVSCSGCQCYVSFPTSTSYPSLINTGTSGVPSRGFSVLQGNDGNIRQFCINGTSWRCSDSDTIIVKLHPELAYTHFLLHRCYKRILALPKSSVSTNCANGNRSPYWPSSIDTSHLGLFHSVLFLFSTCFNRIDLPVYSSKDELREKLKVAIATSATGFVSSVVILTVV